VSDRVGAEAFPQMSGRDLHGRAVKLPDDIPDSRGIVVVAFQRWHQPEVDRWVEMVLALAPLPIVEIPYISTVFRPVAGFVAQGMRGGITGEDARTRTITVYGNQRALARRLGAGVNRPIVIAHRDGVMKTIVQGEPTPEQARSLVAALD
jgi:hypothetical protein